MDAHKDIIQQLRMIETSIVADGIGHLGVRSRTAGFASSRLKCQTPELGILCGYAVTARIETMNADVDEGLGREFIALCAAIAEAPKPAVVVLQECGGHPEYSAHAGEIMSTTFQRVGAVGVVGDAAFRDLAEIKSLGFHCFATGVVAGYGGARIVCVQSPVTVCGLLVEPGDLLHGDVNGLIKVPAEGRERLLEAIAEMRGRELDLLAYVKGEAFTIEGLRDRLGVGENR